MKEVLASYSGTNAKEGRTVRRKRMVIVRNDKNRNALLCNSLHHPFFYAHILWIVPFLSVFVKGNPNSNRKIIGISKGYPELFKVMRRRAVFAKNETQSAGTLCAFRLLETKFLISNAPNRCAVLGCPEIHFSRFPV